MKLFAGAIGLVAVLLAVAPASARSVDEKIERDDVFLVPKDDPVMADAMMRAKETLPEFLEKLQHPSPGTERFLVKIGLRERGNRHTEYVWIADLRQNGSSLVGTLDNQPRWVLTHKKGDRIAFQKSEIVDWAYLEGDHFRGNFTTCVVLKRESSLEAEAAIKRLGLDCRWTEK